MNLLSLFTIRYAPEPRERGFLQRAQSLERDGARVTVAIPDAAEDRRIFGVNVTGRGLQPVFVRIENLSPPGASPMRLHLVALDPEYDTPREAAALSRFSIGKRLMSFGIVAWFFLPVIGLLICKVVSAHRANRRMEEVFKSVALHPAPVPPGGMAEGFVFANLDVGTKSVAIRLLGTDQAREFEFAITVPGLDADHHQKEFDAQHPTLSAERVDRPALEDRLLKMPTATTNRRGTGSGDPVNLVLIGTFDHILAALGARWDQTETISLATCWRTCRAFLLGSEYRYSPVSPLFLLGRSQDFAMQRIRGSINERLHLRLWAAPLRFLDRPVWVGQISRDIGVRVTHRTWNLTTHRIDPDVDESRDYLVEDLLAAGRVLGAAYLNGVGPCTADAPRRNLTGDPYFTDGRRAVIVVSPTRTAALKIEWW